MVEELEGNSSTEEKDDGSRTTKLADDTPLTQGMWDHREIKLRKSYENKYKRLKEETDAKLAQYKKDIQMRDASEVEKIQYELEKANELIFSLQDENKKYLKEKIQFSVEKIAASNNAIQPEMVWKCIRDEIDDSSNVEKVVVNFLKSNPSFVRSTITTGAGSKLISKSHGKKEYNFLDFSDRETYWKDHLQKIKTEE